MNAPIVPPRPKKIVYPDSDGQPMSDNTRQFRYIVTIKEGLEAQYHTDPQVFVAGDLLWYPVEGEPTIRQAPDVLVAFGRPKGDRGSYRQWEEGGIAPQVVFEILSPGNRLAELIRKFHFYQRHGVAEYYVYDPDRGTLEGWLRAEDELRDVPNMEGWVSPRLQVRFTLVGNDLELYHPDGSRFLTYLELVALHEQERQAKEQAQRQAEQERQAKEQAQRQNEQVQRQLERLRAQLRALGVEPENDPGANSTSGGP
jgi:Uma2 family endonuclease